MQKEMPKLTEKDWPEIRKIKASNNTGWRYFENLVKAMHKNLGEEKTCEILSEIKVSHGRLITAGDTCCEIFFEEMDV